MNGRRGRGQALVEFALIFPLLVLLLLAIFDAGRMVFAYNVVANAAREAGRTAIINQNPTDIREKAAQQANTIGVPSGDPGGCPAAGGPSTSATAGTCVVFRTGDLSAACSTPDVGCNAVVSVEWEWRAITPIVSNLMGPISLNATTTQVIEKACTGDTCLDR